jgi:hypothetical protein
MLHKIRFAISAFSLRSYSLKQSSSCQRLLKAQYRVTIFFLGVSILPSKMKTTS